jgi:hypothetical protein
MGVVGLGFTVTANASWWLAFGWVHRLRCITNGLFGRCRSVSG